MYYPYFRGKQYDLITIREQSDLIASAGFIPIIEPVKEAINGLKRTLESLRLSNGSAVVILNPANGFYKDDNTQPIRDILTEDFGEYRNFLAGILLVEQTDLHEIQSLLQEHSDRPIAFIHAGFSAPKLILELNIPSETHITHIFIEQYCGKLYRKHFAGANRVLVKDGFKKRSANKLHPDVEPFSDLHITYTEESVDGFGDFLIVGDDYSESGGPAWSVAIHITFIDHENDDEMYLYHFKSDRNDTPTDPAGKFLEALEKLVTNVGDSETKIYRTSAIEEFIRLYQSQHFPGLGYVKKLSMQHHIETMAHYLSKQ
ncbi:sce7725 family protein [Rheinheimera soli]|jgi:hypothetical protein|uniref:sce7725 family protein n=1 Tax=Rheinheimera soli TaxID=443616 RepID=UPI001E389670|nr:sce7725 family protein [Rheinheimera soli]